VSELRFLSALVPNDSNALFFAGRLAFGGLKPGTAKLEALGEQLDSGDIAKRKARLDRRS
jgi:hypothetical protein